MTMAVAVPRTITAYAYGHAYGHARDHDHDHDHDPAHACSAPGDGGGVQGIHKPRGCWYHP
eukprot:CAMPEP_0119535124 /NCGR_PEP_ID=MMETSP1344-20130328/48230_1 /TAXON_ID=236787 /ORGANISM="Florenciella parvula, Strain CCMP2471" /LENGTH=60 /DNA_ID=CAMNT_0007576619 /DNA_START=139 /DNA_END=318 /DNA_ORIENTATION=+